MSFSNLGLDEALLSAIARKGYTTATPIQMRAIPAVLNRSDLLAAAQTGTGKTAAFVLPMLQLMSTQSTGKHVRALILTPTRELAAQVAESARNYGGNLSLRTTMIFGGVSPVPQVKALRAGVDIVVATPGLDHLNQGNIDLSRIEFLVLDEADRMLDMGFIHDIRRIVAKLPAKRQNLMFSATFSDEIRTLANQFLTKPVEIDVAPRNTAAELVEQKYVLVQKSRKRLLLSWMITRKNWKQVLVFTRTKHGANRLCEQLNDDGLTAEALHGNKSQAARTKALANFSSGRSRVLVATDIAARGIDIAELPNVVNYELPHVPEDYVHRIGRTGRAGTEGHALSLVDGEELDSLRRIERLLKRDIPALSLEDQFDTGLTMAEAVKASANASRAPSNTRQARPDGNRPHRQQAHAKPGGNSHAPRNGNRAGPSSSKAAPSGQRRNANHRPSRTHGENSNKAG